MSGRRSRTRGGGPETEPAVEPPAPTENAERDEAGRDEHDEPATTEDGGARTSEAGGGGAGTGVNQEAVTTAVLNALSNPEVVRTLLAVVSPDGGSGSASSTPAADGLQNLYTIVKYCLNRVQCRRSLIATSFEEQWKPEDCNNKCDVCQRLCSSSRSSDSLSAKSGARYITVDDDVSGHCQSLVEIIEQAQQKQQRLTALKLVEAWKKKASNASVILPGEAACDADTRREEIILRAIFEGVLKEEFHFTPYSTISYIGLGRKAAGVKKGVIRVTMKFVARETASSSSKKHKSSTSTLEQAGDERAPDGSHDTPAPGPSVKKRVLPKMILDAPADDDDDFKPRAKKRRTQSNKQTDVCQMRERTVSAGESGHHQDCETRVADIITID